MKCILLTASLFFTIQKIESQNLDSFFAVPQAIELKVSTPQPRLGETFQISLDINHLRGNVFRSLYGKVRLANEITPSDHEDLTMSVVALKKGKTEIGPIEFFVDKTKYTTNKVSYEVIEGLPDTDNGLWFRKVNIGDSTFCIIIEQRIPAEKKKTEQNGVISFTTEPVTTEIVKFKDTYSIEGLSSAGSSTRTNFESLEIGGERKEFMVGYSIYYFVIEDKSLKIQLTKDKLQNLPRDYEFKEIIIQ